MSELTPDEVCLAILLMMPFSLIDVAFIVNKTGITTILQLMYVSFFYINNVLELTCHG